MVNSNNRNEVSYGYRRKGSVLVAEEREAEAVVRIFLKAIDRLKEIGK